LSREHAFQEEKDSRYSVAREKQAISEEDLFLNAFTFIALNVEEDATNTQQEND